MSHAVNIGGDAVGASVARGIRLFTWCAFVLTAGLTPSQAGVRRVEPAEVLPIEQIDSSVRETVAEVIRDNTFHRRGEAETFPCNPRLYLALLSEPTLTLALWKDLGDNPVRLRRVAPNRFVGTDGAGANASWDIVLRTPQIHVFLSKLDYDSPHGKTHLDARIVLIVRTNYFKEPSGSPWIQHDVEAYVKVDSRGWKAVARSFRPVLENLLEDQVREAGSFISLMGRLVESHPDWARGVVAEHAEIEPSLRTRFVALVEKIRKPNASHERPALADAAPTTTALRRR